MPQDAIHLLVKTQETPQEVVIRAAYGNRTYPKIQVIHRIVIMDNFNMPEPGSLCDPWYEFE